MADGTDLGVRADQGADLMDEERYVTVLATVDPGGEVQLFPGFSTTHGHRVLTGRHSEYTAVLLDADGGVLLEQSLGAEDLCTDGGPSLGTALTGKVPLPAATATFRVTRREETLLQIEVPRSAPEVELTWHPAAPIGERTVLTWTARHPEGRPLHYLVMYDPTGDDQWRPLSLVTTELSFDVDLTQLHGGVSARLGVLASDGFHTVQALSDRFRLPLRPCQAFLVEPLDGSVLGVGEPVVLRGQGYWLEEDRPELDSLTWSSSLDGDLGYGARLTARLSRGVHTLTLSAGTGERVGTMSVQVIVGVAVAQPDS